MTWTVLIYGFHTPLKTDRRTSHWPMASATILSQTQSASPSLNSSPFFFQTEESPYINGRYYSKIIISPEENVTLTCTAENQLERTVNSLNVSASEYFISGIKTVRKFEVILH